MTLYQQEKIILDFLPAFFFVDFAEKQYQFFQLRVLNI